MLVGGFFPYDYNVVFLAGGALTEAQCRQLSQNTFRFAYDLVKQTFEMRILNWDFDRELVSLEKLLLLLNRISFSIKLEQLRGDNTIIQSVVLRGVRFASTESRFSKESYSRPSSDNNDIDGLLEMVSKVDRSLNSYTGNGVVRTDVRGTFELLSLEHGHV